MAGAQVEFLVKIYSIGDQQWGPTCGGERPRRECALPPSGDAADGAIESPMCWACTKPIRLTGRERKRAHSHARSRCTTRPVQGKNAADRNLTRRVDSFCHVESACTPRIVTTPLYTTTTRNEKKKKNEEGVCV